MSGSALACDLVVPTIGRASLPRLLAALDRCAGGDGPLPGQVLLVDDRGNGAGREPLPLDDVPARIRGRLRVLRSGGRGPAAARNVGWRAARADWVAFLDDDVVPDPDWLQRLQRDLAAAGPRVAGVEGRIRVPLPTDRRPTDWERTVAGLELARWPTADLVYRRAALAAAGGFDERFRRNYREDADLGLRLVAAGWEIVPGSRAVAHPVGPTDRRVSLRLQAGNADDVLMRRLHGPDWRRRAAAPAGRLRRHAAVAGTGVATLAFAAARRRRLAALAGAAWTAGTAELAWTRIAPGPRTAEEVATMLATSVLMPFHATGHRLRGIVQHRRAVPLPAAAAPAPAAAPAASPARGGGDEVAVPGGPALPEGRALPEGAATTCSRPFPPPRAVLLDRDGTLVVDVPFNGDPDRVEPMPRAREALALLRAAGIPTAVVSNQSGIARGLLREADVEAVNARVEQLLGPLGPWLFCPHGPADRCACRKPAPGLVLDAAGRLGVAPHECAVIGDIGADVEAARAAGARGVLVPTPRTRREEVDAADEVAADLLAAVRLLLGGVLSAAPDPDGARAEVAA